MTLSELPRATVLALVGITASILAVVCVGTASFLIGRYYKAAEFEGRCEYLGRLLAQELNQPQAQALIIARCKQSSK